MKPTTGRGHAALRRSICAAVVGAAFAVSSARAEPVRVRHPESTTHGVLVLTDASGTALAQGEVIQWAESHGEMVSRMVIRFDDGSLYDETVRFTQRPYLRLTGYHLVQRGPSFTESSEIEFDRSGRYRARVRAAGEQKDEDAAGTLDVPEDAYNGMTSLVLKNLPPGSTATTHMIAFTPKPQLLEVQLGLEGTDHYVIGGVAQPVGRFLIQPKVPGVKGVIATVIGKAPPSFHMWLTPEPAPALLRFEGPLYADGPTWRLGPAPPKFKD